MNIESVWDDFTSAEQDMFRRVCRRLLKNTFIVRDKDEDNKKAYFFVSKKQDVFSDYLYYMDFDVALDRENGVAMLRNRVNSGDNNKIQVNHFKLRKIESVILCCLWTLYANKVRSGKLNRVISINMSDLQNELEKCGVKDQVDKRTMEHTLKIFTDFNLIDVVGKVGKYDCKIRLYASLQFALDTEEFQRFAKTAQKQMMAKELGTGDFSDLDSEQEDAEDEEYETDS